MEFIADYFSFFWRTWYMRDGVWVEEQLASLVCVHG